jgi:hypothetical protein
MSHEADTLCFKCGVVNPIMAFDHIAFDRHNLAKCTNCKQKVCMDCSTSRVSIWYTGPSPDFVVACNDCNNHKVNTFTSEQKRVIPNTKRPRPMPVTFCVYCNYRMLIGCQTNTKCHSCDGYVCVTFGNPQDPYGCSYVSQESGPPGGPVISPTTYCKVCKLQNPFEKTF